MESYHDEGLAVAGHNADIQDAEERDHVLQHTSTRKPNGAKGGVAGKQLIWRGGAYRGGSVEEGAEGGVCFDWPHELI